MSIDDLTKLDNLLEQFVVERDAELAESIGKVTSLSLAGKIYSREHDSLERAKFTNRWIHAVCLRNQNYKRQPAPF